MDLQTSYDDTLRHQSVFAMLSTLNSEPLSIEFSKDFLISFLRQFNKQDSDINYAYEFVLSEDNFMIVRNSIEHQGNPYDPDDKIGQSVQRIFHDSRIISILDKVVFDKHREPVFIFFCLVLPKSSLKPLYFRIDHSIPHISFHAEADLMYKVENEISSKCDIRSLLGCREFNRVLTVLAGSPGWSQNISSVRGGYVSKNNGTLLATENDLHSFMSTLAALGKDYLLPGITIPGLIQKKDLFFEIVESLDNLDRLENKKFQYYLRSKYEFSFNYYKNTQINPAGLGDSSIMINNSLAGAKFGINDQTNLLIQNDVFKAQDNLSSYRSYLILHYSGHGAPNGSLEIEKNVFITPENIFKVSQQKQVPFVIFLDMCFSHIFGEKYQALLQDSGMSGLVFSSNDGIGERFLSYESPKMDNVRRLQTPFKISEDKAVSRGLFSTAFHLGMLKLRDFDEAQSTYTVMSVESFNEKLLIPICAWLSEEYSVPLQRPKIYSS